MLWPEAILAGAAVGEQTRTYRVAGIAELTVTGERFERPKDFDLVRFRTTAARAYEVGLCASPRYRGR